MKYRAHSTRWTEIADGQPSADTAAKMRYPFGSSKERCGDTYRAEFGISAGFVSWLRYPYNQPLEGY